MKHPRERVVLLLAATAISALVSLIPVLRRQVVDWRGRSESDRGPGRSDSDGGHVHEARIDELRRALPPRGLVGYVSDRERPEGERGKLDDHQLYMLEYDLAPVILDEAWEKHALVVGKFKDAEKGRRLFAEKGLVIEKDLGSGLLLGRRRGP